MADGIPLVDIGALPGPPMPSVRQHVVQVVDNMLVLDRRERDRGLVPGTA